MLRRVVGLSALAIVLSLAGCSPDTGESCDDFECDDGCLADSYTLGGLCQGDECICSGTNIEACNRICAGPTAAASSCCFRGCDELGWDDGACAYNGGDEPECVCVDF